VLVHGLLIWVFEGNSTVFAPILEYGKLFWGLGSAPNFLD